jgi:hypothetical protein
MISSGSGLASSKEAAGGMMAMAATTEGLRKKSSESRFGNEAEGERKNDHSVVLETSGQNQ